MKTTILMRISVLLAAAVLGLGVLASTSMPLAGGISGTTTRLQGSAEVIRSMSGLMATHEVAAVRGLSIALQNQAEKASAELSTLDSLDLSTADDTQLAEFAAALTEFNLALKSAIQVCDLVQASETSAALASTRATVSSYVSRTLLGDTRFETAILDASLAYPGEGELWIQR